MTTMYGPTGCALHKWNGYGGMTHTQELCLMDALLLCSSHRVGPLHLPHLECVTFSATCGMGAGSWSYPKEALNKGRWEEKRQQDKLTGPQPLRSNSRITSSMLPSLISPRNVAVATLGPSSLTCCCLAAFGVRVSVTFG